MTSNQRIFHYIETAGYPVFSVVITSSTSAIVVPRDSSNQLSVDQLMDSFDWTDEAEQLWQKQQAIAAAKTIISTPGTELETRTPCTALNLSLKEVRVKVNEILAALKTDLPESTPIQIIEPLQTGSTPEQDIATMFYLLDKNMVQ